VKPIFSGVFISFLGIAVASATALQQPLQTAAAVDKSIAHVITLDGKIEAVNRSTLSAQTSGQVIQTLADVGDLVQKNQVILRLRDTEQQAVLQRAVAAVEAARAHARDTAKEYVRVKDIRGRKLVSQSTLDRATAARDAAQANLKAARARRGRAREKLSYTTVRAPFTGIVEQRLVEVGESVHPGTPLYTGMSLDRVRVVVAIPQSDIDAVRRYRLAEVTLGDASRIMVGGDAFRFFAYADPQTSSFKVRVNLPQGQHGLYPGMYLKTAFKIGERRALVIPTQAVVHRASMTAVYVVTDNQIEFRQIRLGRALDPQHQEVLAGLKAGERVALQPQLALALRQKQGPERATGGVQP